MTFKEVALVAIAITTTALALYISNGKVQTDDGIHKNAFKAYVAKSKKQYSSVEEFEYRYHVFANNKEYINKRNNENLSFTLGENQFADLTFEEFKSKYLAQMPIRNSASKALRSKVKVTCGDVDWRRQNAVTEVKNQGACGSCWAFSTTGSFESAYAIKNKKLLEFSESELVDCSASYSNNGCNGGLMSYAFNYIKDNQLALEFDYPYTPVTGQCKSDKSKQRVGISSYSKIDPVNIQGLVAGVHQTPISVAIEVRQDFQLYKAGVYTNTDATCGDSLNHGVLAMGYYITDHDAGSYFIVKNSWGNTWGEQGYVRIAFGKTDRGTCGIANDYAVYPIL